MRVGRRTPRRRATQRRLAFQSLEARQLLAANIGLSDGFLTIAGTEFDDAVEVFPEGEQIVVSTSQAGDARAAEAQSFPASELRGIYFDGGAGDDVLVNDTDLPVIARGGPGNDVLIGGAGHDVLHGGSGDDVLLGQQDTLLGGNGQNAMPVIEQPGQDVPDEGMLDTEPAPETNTEPEPAAEAIEEPAIAETTEEAGADANAEPVAEPAAEEVIEPAAEEVTEPVAEPVAEEVTEPVAEEVIEPVAEPVAEEVTEPVAEPVADEAAEPVSTEPVSTEPVATEPVAEDQSSDVEPQQPTADQPEHVALDEPLAVTYTSSVTVLAGLEELGLESQVITHLRSAYHRPGSEPGGAAEAAVAEATTEQLVCPTLEAAAEQQPAAAVEEAPEPVGPEASPDDTAEPLAIAPETTAEPTTVEAVPLESVPEPLPAGSEEVAATEQSPALSVVGEDDLADPADTGELQIAEEATSFNDLVIGGPGADMLYGGEGDDLLFGDDLDSDLLSDLVSAWTLGRSQLLS